MDDNTILSSSFQISYSQRRCNEYSFYFSGYLGYYLLGYFIHIINKPVKWFWLLGAYVFCIGLLVIKEINEWESIDPELFWYLGIFTVIMTTCIFEWLGIN